MGFVDARGLPAGHRIEADLCVVGSGAAGLTIASHFMGGPRRVAVLESGGLAADAEVQSLNAGEIVGQQDAPLVGSRLRYFGGTTNHWTAHVHPLAPIDFEPRPWVPDSEWPFRFPTLAPYYDKAGEFFGLPARPFDVDAWMREGAPPAWRFEGRRVESSVVRVLPRANARLGPRLRAAIEKSENVTVFLFANVLEFRPNESEDRVRDVRLQAIGGQELTAQARDYVLAAGGIENARILLLSSGERERGFANRENLVGAFFANHPEAGVAELWLTDPGQGAGFYQLRANPLAAGFGTLALSAGLQRQAEVQNCSFRVDPHGFVGPAGAQSTDLGPHVVEVAREMDAPRRSPAPAPGRTTPCVLRAFLEPAPNRDSRVRLGRERDRFGQRRAALDWRLGESDSRSLGRTVKVLAQQLGASGLGRLRGRFPKEGFRVVDPRGSFHHMGTTRMHQDPKRGVVDANCRLHGVSNLFVAGSSVFPTYGTVNPTFTIVALALRLADHLEGRMA
jgi:choline dehydrogenase-like flavoprotein